MILISIIFSSNIKTTINNTRRASATVYETKQYYLIEDLDREPLATLATFERFLAIMEALVVLFQVAQAIKHFVALSTAVFTRHVGTRRIGPGGTDRNGSPIAGQSRGRGSFQTISRRGRGSRFTEAFVEVAGCHR